MYRIKYRFYEELGNDYIKFKIKDPFNPYNRGLYENINITNNIHDLHIKSVKKHNTSNIRVFINLKR